MGNTNTKLPTSPEVPEKMPAGGIIQNLQDDITCSICLEPFNDPVSIDCGHNFCRVCLSSHWSGFSRYGFRCPECRHLCSPDRMKSDTRLRSLVEKIGQIPVQEDADKEPERQTTVLQPGPVQLVGLDENGDICLNEEALNYCLQEGQVKDTPVCLISILGEQRCGKSFLLNFLLRRFQNLEAENESWMGQEDEPLTGFEWRRGFNTTTKGVWIWNQPFWVSTEHGKVAVFLMDTEGSMDIERRKEVGVKISAFSMLLSSYLILNLDKKMKDTDLEYLEMFLHVAETVGKACKLKPIQNLDVLVRDWYFTANFGFQEGNNFLQRIIQKLKDHSNSHPRALVALESTHTCCYLMPFPGKKLVMGTEGRLSELDKDFRDCLKEYGNHLARSAAAHVKRDQEGGILTGEQLSARVKNFLTLMNQHKFGFSSATQMAITLHNLHTLETLRKDFSEFISQQEKQSRPLFAGLRVTPSTMTRGILKKQHELVQQCERLVQGDEPEQLNSASLLKSQLQSDAKDFLERYGRRYKSHALKAGVAVGVGAVGLAGGIIGAGVAAAVLATEAIVLSTGTAATFGIGTVAGAGTFGLLGGGVGAGVGSKIGENRAREAANVIEGDAEDEEEESNLSDQKCLIGSRDSL
uniref:Uncharacterized protein n=1 Tax=Salvator merianae TaxID=96440 RepID=A0A8D0BMN4_SALMN